MRTHGRGLRRAAVRGAVCLGFAVGSFLGLACASDATSPEERVRAVLADLEEAAGRKNAPAMREHVSEGYADAQGNDKRAIAQLVAFHLLRNQSVYLLTRVQSIEIEPAGEARADVLVAMAGTPIAGPEALRGLRADLYRFDLRLGEEQDGAWRVRSAQWRPAGVDDFH